MFNKSADRKYKGDTPVLNITVCRVTVFILVAASEFPVYGAAILHVSGGRSRDLIKSLNDIAATVMSTPTQCYVGVIVTSGGSRNSEWGGGLPLPSLQPSLFSLHLPSLFPSLPSLPSEVGPLNLVRVSVEGCTVNAQRPSPKGGGGRLVRL